MRYQWTKCAWLFILGVGSLGTTCFCCFLRFPRASRLLCAFAFCPPRLVPTLRPFAFRAPLLASVFCFCPRFVLRDKKRVLFCGFTEANFFATWGNAENRRSGSQKSTEKWGVFIMGDFVVREVDRVRRMNKAILGCTWNRRCACVFVVRCNREVRCKARRSLRKLLIRRSLAKLGENAQRTHKVKQCERYFGD